MNSLFSARAASSGFRRQWRGYDRAQVDEFLRQTAADRQRLQEGLAQLEILMASHDRESREAAIAAAQREARDIRTRAQEEAERRLRETANQTKFLLYERLEANRREIDRLTTLRREVASCLETSIGALRTATDLLSVNGDAPSEESRPAAGAPMRAMAARALTLPQWMSRRKVYAVLTFAAACCALAAAVAFRGVGASEISAEDAGGRQAVSAPAAAEEREPAVRPSSSLSGGSAGARTDGLVLTLTAQRASWISTVIDGGQRLERLLKASETIMVHAHDDAVLRVGDAGALSVLINNRLARPLGANGEVVTARITSANYLDFLVKDAAAP